MNTAPMILLDEPTDFVKALNVLPFARRQAVLNARNAWTAAGLSDLLATKKAITLAERLARQRQQMLQRLRRRQHAQPLFHSAADLHEAKLTRLIAGILASVKASLGSQTELEHLIRIRDRSAVESVIAHVPMIMKDALEERLTEALLDALAEGAGIAVRQIMKAA